MSNKVLKSKTSLPLAQHEALCVLMDGRPCLGMKCLPFGETIAGRHICKLALIPGSLSYVAEVFNRILPMIEIIAESAISSAADDDLDDDLDDDDLDDLDNDEVDDEEIKEYDLVALAVSLSEGLSEEQQKALYEKLKNVSQDKQDQVGETDSVDDRG